MKILKSIAVAFSMYSKIPMPRFNWGSEDMEYHFIFFPWVGAVIAVLEYLWYKLFLYFDMNKLFFLGVAAVIPLIVTGGFHLDGFMDVSDALSSYQPKEKRLEILKDPHIGAFSVIKLLVLAGIFLGALSELSILGEAFGAWCFSFVISRDLSGISALTFKNAKGKGSLATESATAKSKIVLIFLVLELLAAAVVLCFSWPIFGGVELVSFLVCFLYYRFSSYKNFGGITGDLCGWFVSVSEAFTALALAVAAMISIGAV